jgi:O-antigen ligase
MALGGLAAAGAGIAAQEQPLLVFDVALAGCAAVAIALRPFEALLALLLVRATAANSVFLDLATCVGGAIALVLCARRLPAKAMIVPLALFLLITLPFVPFVPSPDEGRQPPGFFLPVLGFRYMDAPSTELLQWLRVGAAASALGLAAWTVRSRFRLDVVVGVILAGAAVPVYKGIEQLVSGDYSPRAGFDAVAGPFYHPNYFAFYLVVVLAVGIAAILEARELRLRVPLAVLLTGATVCLTFTYTRAAWLGFGCLVLTMALLSYRRVLVVAAVAVLLAALAVPSLAGSVEERVKQVSSPTSGQDDSWEWRKGEWRRMLPNGLEHPIVGNGFGSYSRVSVEEFGLLDPTYSTRIEADRTKHGFAAHNDYLKMFVETGFPGLALWVAMLVGAGLTMARARHVPGLRAYASAGLALTIVFAGMSVSDNIQAYTAVPLYALAFLGAVAGAAARIRAGRAPGAGPTGSSAEPRPGEAR